MSLSNMIKNSGLKMLADYQGLIIAEVIAYNSSDLTCDIQYKKFSNEHSEDGVEQVTYPKAFGIPINILGGSGFFVTGEFKKGDFVAVAVGVSEISTGVTSDKSKFLSKDNAFIIGGISNTAPSFLSDGKFVAGKSSAFIAIDDNSVSIIIGGKTTGTEILFEAGEITIKVAGIKTWGATTHMHPTAATGPPSAPIPGT